ncbi:asparagine synthase-related protein [Thauera mechernichensis]
MLAAEGLSSADMQVQASDAGMLATSHPACSTATDLGAGCLAAVLGRPRWADASLAARARAEGVAAAALAAYRDGGEASLGRLQGNFAIVLIDMR